MLRQEYITISRPQDVAIRAHVLRNSWQTALKRATKKVAQCGSLIDEEKNELPLTKVVPTGIEPVSKV